MMKKLIYFAGWTILLCCLLLFCVLLTVWFNERLWLAIMLWIFTVVTVLLFRAAWIGLVNLWKKENFRYFSRATMFSRLEHVLFEHWKSGSSLIKRMGRKKNAACWFILVGEKSGKTSLLAGAGLPVMSHQSDHETVVPTRTLRWWFFKTACYMDTGSYFLSAKPAALAAWKNLATWCGRLTSPGGIVVCVSSRDLLTLSPLALHQQGRKLRSRCEPLMKAFGRKLPLYIVLTECDNLSGFTAWAAKLTDEQRQQALGFCWREVPIVDRQDMTLLDPLFNTLQQGIDISRMSMMQGGIPDAQTHELLQLNQALPLLRSPLHDYVSALCESDAWNPGGALAGIWLTASITSSPQQKRRQTLFAQKLLAEVLPDYSQCALPQALNPRRQWLRQWQMPILAAVLAGLLLTSAWQSRALMVSADSRDVAELSQRISLNETWQNQPLRYMPFLPLLRHRHESLERALVAAAGPVTLNDHRTQLRAFREAFYKSGPPQQRMMILQLSQAILTREAMLKGEPLNVLANRPLPPVGLQLISEAERVGELEKLALTRAQLRVGGTRSGIPDMQQTLNELINSDAQWRWLVANNPQIKALPLNHFWAMTMSNSALSGIWLEGGQQFLEQYIAVVQLAMGEKEVLPVFAAFWRHYPQLKQEAWLKFLLEVTRQQALTPGKKATDAQLLALVKGDDPNTLFIQRATAELTAISESQAQPWLTEMRRIDALQREPDGFPLLNKLIAKEQDLRGSLRHGLFDTPTNAALNGRDIELWQQWRSTVALSVNLALTDKGHHPILTAGLAGKGDEQTNPLTQLYLSWAQLRQQMAHPDKNVGRDAVWALLESQHALLTVNALSRSACWLEQNWQSQVLKPLGNRAEQRDAKQQQEKAKNHLTDFMQVAAMPLLTRTETGLRPLEFGGHSLPLTADFLEMVNHVVDPDDLLRMPDRAITRDHDAISQLDQQIAQSEKKRTDLESKSQNVELISLPATVPGGARLMPVGTRVTLHCARQSSVLDSGNLRESASFSWVPGQCDAVTLTVRFPGTELNYRYMGDDAWNEFLSDFDQGERAFALNEFSPEGTQPLSELGIEKVLVRYQLQGQEETFKRWQAWKRLKDDIEELHAERGVLLARQQARLHHDYFQGKLATLPTSVAMCIN